MKVNAISAQNFRGILTTSRTVYDNVGVTYDIWYEKFEEAGDRKEERDYYPFSNETREDIRRAIRPYTETHHSGEVTEYREVNIKPALPITKAKFMQYLNDELLSAETARIRDYFVRNKLQYFLKENNPLRSFHII